jgi:hypothetical protein
VLSILKDPFDDTDTLYFAVRSRDNTGNLSPMSNVLVLTGNMVGLEGGLQAGLMVQFRSFPNPFYPNTKLYYRGPGKAPLKIRIYDMRGRLVRDLTPLVKANPGSLSGFVSWDGQDRLGRNAGTGVYVAQMVSGKLVRKVKLVMVK